MKSKILEIRERDAVVDVDWYHKHPCATGEMAIDRRTLLAAYDELLARARVAREALREIRSVHPLMHNGGNWNKFVDEALAAIGPLPPHGGGG